MQPLRASSERVREVIIRSYPNKRTNLRRVLSRAIILPISEIDNVFEDAGERMEARELAITRSYRDGFQGNAVNASNPLFGELRST